MLTVTLCITVELCLSP